MFNLVTTETSFDLTNTKEYAAMVETIQTNLPIIEEASAHFGKSQSQFMDNFLTVSHPTPLRNARQILAELNRIISALKEAQYTHGKNEIKLKRLDKELNTLTDELDIEEKQLEINHLKSGMINGRIYIEGAVRSATNYIEQYNQIMKSHGYDKMSEVEFEMEEEKYHIMKAFEQAICAARARGGLIDEGNHIYFMQIGINGAVAQAHINALFKEEAEHLAKNNVPDGAYLHSFLEYMASTFAGCSKFVSSRKKVTDQTPTALIGH